MTSDINNASCTPSIPDEIVYSNQLPDDIFDTEEEVSLILRLCRTLIKVSICSLRHQHLSIIQFQLRLFRCNIPEVPPLQRRPRNCHLFLVHRQCHCHQFHVPVLCMASSDDLTKDHESQKMAKMKRRWLRNENDFGSQLYER